MTNITARFAIVLVCACVMSVATFVGLAVFSEPSTAAPETLETLLVVADSADSQSADPKSVLQVRPMAGDDVSDWVREVGSNARDGDDLRVLVPARTAGRFAEVSVRRTDALRAVSVADRSLLVGTGLVFAIFVLTAVVLSWPLVSRIKKQEYAITRLADGDLSARVEAGRQDVVGRLSTRINAMADRIQDLVESHESLLQTVSHEMRTPISRMHFSLQLLQESISEAGFGDGVEAESEKRFAAMRDDMQEIDSLLGELLTFSRLRSGEEQPESEPVDLKPMLERILATHAPCHPSVVGDADCTGEELVVTGSERLLQRAIDNVVRNAFRFASSRVQLTASREGGTAIVRIQDDGPGIPDEDRARVFEPFVQLTSSNSSGTGLGLAIAKRIVEMHAGTIHFEPCDVGAVCVMTFAV